VRNCRHPPALGGYHQSVLLNLQPTKPARPLPLLHQAFNGHVADLAAFTSKCLTITYSAIYGSSDDDELVIKPMHARSLEELVAVHGSGLIPTKHLAPVVMAVLG